TWPPPASSSSAPRPAAGPSCAPCASTTAPRRCSLPGGPDGPSSCTRSPTTTPSPTCRPATCCWPTSCGPAATGPTSTASTSSPTSPGTPGGTPRSTPPTRPARSCSAGRAGSWRPRGRRPGRCGVACRALDPSVRLVAVTEAVPATEIVSYPGARPPDRRRTVVSHGIRLAVHEWGDPDAPPLMLVHGGFDFARTFDVFAPMLADAGWRVVAWDQRGHGDSDHAAMYSWEADLRDALAVIDSTTSEPVPVVGHSKGGSLMTQFAAALPHRLKALVNLDGLPHDRPMPDVPDRERTKLLAEELAGWLDFRRSTATRSRRPDTLDGMAERDRKSTSMNSSIMKI